MGASRKPNTKSLYLSRSSAPDSRGRRLRHVASSCSRSSASCNHTLEAVWKNRRASSLAVDAAYSEQHRAFVRQYAMLRGITALPLFTGGSAVILVSQPPGPGAVMCR